MNAARIIIAGVFAAAGVALFLVPAPTIHGTAKTVLGIGVTAFLAVMFFVDMRGLRDERREDAETRTNIQGIPVPGDDDPVRILRDEFGIDGQSSEGGAR